MVNLLLGDSKALTKGDEASALEEHIKEHRCNAWSSNGQCKNIYEPFQSTRK